MPRPRPAAVSATKLALAAGSLTLIAVPLSTLLYLARNDPPLQGLMMRCSALAGFVGLVIWALACIIERVLYEWQQSPAAARLLELDRHTHINTHGNRVLPLPAQLVSLLVARKEYAPLAEAQAINGGIPVPIPPGLFAVVLQFTDECLNNNSLGYGVRRRVEAFNDAVFLATHQLQLGDPVERGPSKC